MLRISSEAIAVGRRRFRQGSWLVTRSSGNQAGVLIFHHWRPSWYQPNDIGVIATLIDAARIESCFQGSSHHQLHLASMGTHSTTHSMTT